MGRWERSLELVRQSVAVLRGSPGLMLFPLVACVTSLTVSAVLFVPVALIAWGSVRGGHHLPHRDPAWFGVLTAVDFLVTSFVVRFFAVAVAGGAYQAMHGRKTSFAEGMGYATVRIPAILGWTAIASTVGLALNAVERRAGWLGFAVGLVSEVAWSVATYFVVPVIAIEGKGPVTALQKSTAMLRRTWGEQLIGNVSVRFVFRVLSWLAVVPIALSIATLSAAVIVPVVAGSLVYLIALAVMASSVMAVYQVALYLYATTGTVPAGFNPYNFTSAFSPRGGLAGAFDGF